MTRNPHPDLPDIAMTNDALDERLLALLQKGPIAARDAAKELGVNKFEAARSYRRLWDAGKAHAEGWALKSRWVAGSAPNATGAKPRRKSMATIAKKLPKPRRRLKLAPPVPIPSQDATVVSLRQKAEFHQRKADRLRTLADELEELES